MRASGGRDENGDVRLMVKRLCSREFQMFNNCSSGSLRPVIAGSGSASAIAFATPMACAEGHPSSAGANVSQIASSARCCRAVNFIGESSCLPKSAAFSLAKSAGVVSGDDSAGGIQKIGERRARSSRALPFSPFRGTGKSDGGRLAGRVLACLLNPANQKKVPAWREKSG